MIAWLLCCTLASHAGEGFDAWLPSQPVQAQPPEAADGYRFQAAVFHDIAATMEKHPDRVTAEQIGQSLEGRPIWAFHLDPDGPVDRKVLVFAGIHALEWISTETATTLLVDAIAAPPERVRLTVIPLLNPDGRAKVESDLRAHRNAYRRGNRDNVDLNRDFAVHREATSVWSKLLPGYHATTASPLSQPESRALDQLADRERYDRSASLHAFGGFFYYPWSGTWQRPDDWETFVRLGRAMEQAQGPRAYKTRQLSRWGFFFRAHGSEIDHLYGEYGTLAYLVELTRSGITPFRPSTFRTYFRWYNPRRPGRHVEKGTKAMWALIRED